jgi:hypothetical protein
MRYAVIGRTRVTRAGAIDMRVRHAGGSMAVRKRGVAAARNRARNSDKNAGPHEITDMIMAAPRHPKERRHHSRLAHQAIQCPSLRRPQKALMRLLHRLRLLLPPSNLEAIGNVRGAVGAVGVVAGVAAVEVRTTHTHDLITAQINLCQAATMARFAPIREQRTDHRPRIK